ncbi:MAG: hypothetical protein A2428_13465 [Bdellovibrionales bacterium RIFOXYC1_FULL_54_43]|nr:MAG: hypothetical protein A2428_13465 [Bdellovibrionales bacterium RIFOXYC1_FULL_54_43]
MFANPARKSLIQINRNTNVHAASVTVPLLFRPPLLKPIALLGFEHMTVIHAIERRMSTEKLADLSA